MSRKLYITADATDNSVVLSAKMCAALRVEEGGIPHVMVFRTSDTKEYALMRVKASMADVTECPVVSYNPLTKEVGFMSTVPTVNRIFYDMGIDRQVARLRIKKCVLEGNKTVYVIKR